MRGREETRDPTECGSPLAFFYEVRLLNGKGFQQLIDSISTNCVRPCWSFSSSESLPHTRQKCRRCCLGSGCTRLSGARSRHTQIPWTGLRRVELKENKGVASIRNLWALAQLEPNWRHREWRISKDLQMMNTANADSSCSDLKFVSLHGLISFANLLPSGTHTWSTLEDISATRSYRKGKWRLTRWGEASASGHIHPRAGPAMAVPPSWKFQPPGRTPIRQWAHMPFNRTDSGGKKTIYQDNPL